MAAGFTMSRSEKKLITDNTKVFILDIEEYLTSIIFINHDGSLNRIHYCLGGFPFKRYCAFDIFNRSSENLVTFKNLITYLKTKLNKQQVYKNSC